MKSLQKKLNKIDIIYVSIENLDSLNKINDLFCHGILFEPDNKIEYFYAGVYFDIIEKKFKIAKKYYLTAIDHGDIHAMYNLGMHYRDIKNYTKAKKYFLMAIEHGNSLAMDSLAFYYEEIKKNYVKAEKYYLMAIGHGNSTSMYNLAVYFEDIKKNYVKAEKYYLMAIEHGNSSAMNNLAWHYENVKKNYRKSKKYYLMAIKHGNVTAMYNLAIYYKDVKKNHVKTEKYYLMSIDHNYERSFNALFCHYKNIKNYEKLLKFCVKYYEHFDRSDVIYVIKTLWNSKLNSESNEHFIKLLLSFETFEDDTFSISLRTFINVLHQKINTIKLHFEKK